MEAAILMIKKLKRVATVDTKLSDPVSLSRYIDFLPRWDAFLAKHPGLVEEVRYPWIEMSTFSCLMKL